LPGPSPLGKGGQGFGRAESAARGGRGAKKPRIGPRQKPAAGGWSFLRPLVCVSLFSRNREALGRSRGVPPIPPRAFQASGWSAVGFCGAFQASPHRPLHVQMPTRCSPTKIIRRGGRTENRHGFSAPRGRLSSHTRGWWPEEPQCAVGGTISEFCLRRR